MPTMIPVLKLQFTDQRPSPLQWDIITGILSEVEGFQSSYDLSVSPAEANETPREAIVTFSGDFQETWFSIAKRLPSDLANLFDGLAVRAEITEIAEENWVESWKRFYQVTRVGERLYFGPPWEGKLPADAPADARLVIIEPGQAFGTGSHETTRLCLQVLERNVIPGGTLLDVGTGSGILAFAALHLGESHAIGVEYDPVCEENFELNARHNGAYSNACFILDADPEAGMQEAISRGFPYPDHVVCNTLNEQFLPLLPALRRIQRPLILSGFLESEIEAVRSAVQQHGFRVLGEFAMDQWRAFSCEPVG
jgi:ribosomal protein L11 methyltransferase